MKHEISRDSKPLRNTFLSYYTKVVDRVPILTENFETLSNPGLGYGASLFSASCTTCPWDFGRNAGRDVENSAACAVEELPSIVDTIHSILSLIPAGFQRIQIRFHPPARGLIHFSWGRESVVFGLIYQGMSNSTRSNSGLGAYQGIMQALIQKHGCRPHWGKDGLYYVTFDVLRKALPYQNWLAFKAAQKVYDPFGMFQNKFSRRLNGLGRRLDADPVDLEHCALLDNCRCETDEDCDPSQEQKCSRLNNREGGRPLQSFRVCKDTKRYENKAVSGYDSYNYSSIVEAIFRE